MNGYHTVRHWHRVNLRSAVARQNGHCFYCNSPFCKRGGGDMNRRATLDHREPQARGGSDDEGNLVAACFKCNHAKGDMSEAEFLARKRSASADTHPQGGDGEAAPFMSGAVPSESEGDAHA